MRRFARFLVFLFVVVLAVGVGAGLWVREQIRGSLPILVGEVVVEGPVAPVRIDRDGLGIPTLRAKTRADLAFATGFVHGQDRYFQMDLLRRNAAGELAELFGPVVKKKDVDVRVYRLRWRAKKVLEQAAPDERAILDSYARGVNAGLGGLKKTPFEYQLLRLDPKPWEAEDSLLVLYTMYLQLQGTDAATESSRGLVYELLPPKVAEFVWPRGTQWDAPMDGGPFEVPPTPGPELLDLRKLAAEVGRPAAPLSSDRFDDVAVGSNNWAVAGSRTVSGRAIVADDMHLGLQVPTIWYRASFVWPGEKSNGEMQTITGVTLPGAPAIIVGSNQHVAWGFTNAEGDWGDLVVLEVDKADPMNYKTPTGSQRIEITREVVKVKDAPDETIEVPSTIWGPVVDKDYKGRPRAHHWVALDPRGLNFGLMKMESVKTLEAALDQANKSGSPEQNFVVADDKGRIAWTILGQIPRRVGFDGWIPTSWADGTKKWDGYLKPEECPRIIQPKDGRIWTANARVVGGEMLQKLGYGEYDLGARQGQIRDDLKGVDRATEADMLKIQLDDRALFLARWQKLMLDVLTPERIGSDANKKELRRLLENWGGRASVDSVGYRAVQEFRWIVVHRVMEPLTRTCKKADASFDHLRIKTAEGPVWRLVTEKPAHLLDPRYKTWDDLLAESVNEIIEKLTKDGRPLAEQTWGKQNTILIQHSISLAVPQLSAWLDMPVLELPGSGANMPRIMRHGIDNRPPAGASQRMAVSPGREQEGYMHIAGGQSGHPFSPFYRAGFDDWAYGRPIPFLPGPTVYTMTLQPKK